MAPFMEDRTAEDEPKLHVPFIRLSDGPNGIRGTKFFGSVPSACLPCGTAIGATFDSELAVQIGRLLGDETHAKGAHVLLSGRGFESFSEDPLLSGTLAGNYINSLKGKGIHVALEHLVCNDQEHERMAVNSILTDWALRDIYLMPFMIATRLSQTAAMMTAYNKVNGIHVSEDRSILRNIIRKDDWFGTYSRSEVVNTSPSRWRWLVLVHAVSANKISSFELDDRVLVKDSAGARIPENGPEKQLSLPEDRYSAATFCNVLPFFSPKHKVAIATFCGGGSTSLDTYSAVTPLEGIQIIATGGIELSQGAYGFQMQGFRNMLEERHLENSDIFFLDYDHPDLHSGDFTPSESGTYDFGLCLLISNTAAKELIAGQTCRSTTMDFGHGGLRFAIEAAARLAAIVDQWESEGDDRTSMDLPPHTDKLIDRIFDANPNTVIVIKSAKTILHAWYGGNEGGNGIADLPLTFPQRLKDNPTYRSKDGRVLYGEDVYIGYRYYEQTEVAPLFPFGHGLSYTTFLLSRLELSMQIQSDEMIVCCTLTNTGSRAGSEVIQSVKVEFRIDILRDTSFWEEKSCSHAGMYRVSVGASSAGEHLSGKFYVEKTRVWSGL
ncbi:glycoside hydrolase [Corynespora cassiicola Philippines]|uniref:beta-glucosidase n=1 Tax=Corynespora cassiicola Philippines TaxID=1448308 RepID=A0A2T2NYR9_CORCC|nr:glycoside hydrolase [Corynespora cassiicola Philippines]